MTILEHRLDIQFMAASVHRRRHPHKLLQDVTPYRPPPQEEILRIMANDYFCADAYVPRIPIRDDLPEAERLRLEARQAKDNAYRKDVKRHVREVLYPQDPSSRQAYWKRSILVLMCLL